MNYKKIFLTFFLFFPIIIFGADLFFVSPSEVSLEEEFLVKVLINTEENINAVEGKVILSDSIEVKDILLGSSSVNFWIEEPKVFNNTVVFSGITPNGLRGRDLPLFSLILKSKKEGVLDLDIKDLQILLNDGLGTSAKVTIQRSQVLINKDLETKNKIEENIDSIKPEYFQPEILQNEEIHNNKYFLVFVAQDKDSGVSHYEVKEGFFGKFKKASSPYRLINQNLDKKIYIKAVDKSGNERIVRYIPQNYKPIYQKPLFLGIIIIIILFLSKIIWPRFIRF